MGRRKGEEGSKKGLHRGKGEEGSKNYVEGGYHPVDIGDLFNKERYVVRSKLGWGPFSTVWLACDTQLNKYVALKISRSKDNFREMALHEIRILKVISQADPEHTECVVTLLDNFMHSGPNGNHVCLVLELLGDNLKTLLKHYSGKGIPLHMVKEICFHILRGLGFLHDKLSIVHTDLKPENILLPSTIDPEKDPKKLGVPLIPSCNKGKSSIVTSLSSGSNICKSGNQQMGLKQKGKLVAQDCVTVANDEDEKLGVEAQAVQARTWSAERILSDALKENPPEGIRELRIRNPCEKQNSMASLDMECKIAELGNAIRMRSQSIHLQCLSPIQTFRYKCPEILLRSSFSATADIWSVACIAFELATGDFLFKPQGPNRHERALSHLGLMIELLGVMPNTVCLGGNLSTRYFHSNGKLKGYKSLRSRPLINVLQKSYGFLKEDAADFSKFLVHLLDFVPETRPSAMEAIHHPWLTPMLSLLEPSLSSSSAVQTPENDDVVPKAQKFCKTM